MQYLYSYFLSAEIDARLLSCLVAVEDEATIAVEEDETIIAVVEEEDEVVVEEEEEEEAVVDFIPVEAELRIKRLSSNPAETGPRRATVKMVKTAVLRMS